MWLCLDVIPSNPSVFWNHRWRMTAKRAFLTTAYSRSNPRYLRLCKWAAWAANPMHACSIFTSCGRFSTSSWIGGSSAASETVRPSDRRGLSLSPTNLDRPARRLIETDSASHRIRQLDGALLHVSSRARPESCCSAARRAQRRRFTTAPVSARRCRGCNGDSKLRSRCKGRGLTKACGYRMPTSSTRCFAKRSLVVSGSHRNHTYLFYSEGAWDLTMFARCDDTRVPMTASRLWSSRPTEKWQHRTLLSNPSRHRACFENGSSRVRIETRWRATHLKRVLCWRGTIREHCRFDSFNCFQVRSKNTLGESLPHSPLSYWFGSGGQRRDRSLPRLMESVTYRI